MQFQFPVADLGAPLERREVRLVVLVIEAPAGLGGRAQPGQPGPHAIRRQVTDPAVVLVTAAVLAHLGNLKVTDSPDPGGEFFHGHDVTGRPVPPGAG